MGHVGAAWGVRVATMGKEGGIVGYVGEGGIVGYVEALRGMGAAMKGYGEMWGYGATVGTRGRCGAARGHGRDATRTFWGRCRDGVGSP